ncbi:hypothetical protein [Blastococcus tunisiensis]|uniref:hypothetical protein n=1 Tax=Blastococcus tunisiensis TaxID=1798228 RepID=UPI0011142337|nr:hypothetical protein [Blastococcus sp. DSM 46838]
MDRAAARQVLAGLYGHGAGPVTLELDGLASRNDLCIAVWEQQWPRLRRHFSFCSGALEPRRTSQGAFDLLLMPPQYGFAAPPPAPGDGALSDRALAALTDDLNAPGPLRDFLRRCGPDSARRRVMPLLVEAFVATSGDDPPADAVAVVTARAPKAASMRHLKRALLDPKDGLLSDVPPDEMLRTLLRHDVAERLLASDAGLSAWAALVWEREPAAVVAALPPPIAGPGLRGIAPDTRSPGGPTVASAARHDLSTIVADRATPRELSVVAVGDVALAARLVVDRDTEAWWAAWAALPDPAFAETLGTGHFDAQPPLNRAVTALIGTEQGRVRWRALRERAGSPAVAALLSQPGLDGAWARAVAERLDLLADALRAGLDAEQTAAAADVSPDLAFVRTAGFGAYRPLAEATTLWDKAPRRAAVVLATALDAPPGPADYSAARAYDRLYRQFRRDGAWDAWEILSPALPGKTDDWDRCKRLARGLADAVGGRKGPPRPALLESVPAGTARDRLEAELEHKARRAQDDTGKSRRGQSGWEEIVRFIRPW